MKSETEIWKSLPGVTGVEVSTFGRVRTLDRVISGGNGTRSLKGRVLKQRNTKDGYLQVQITINGKRATKKVHRLVAQTFIPNPGNLPQVNHKDCNRINNDVSNLEWCDGFYNQQYREKYGISRAEATGHPLFAINLSTLKVSWFKTQHEAGRELGIRFGNINNVIKGRRKKAGGFWFTNADENVDDIIKRKLNEIKGEA